jgi:hypothetical protein
MANPHICVTPVGKTAKEREINVRSKKLDPQVANLLNKNELGPQIANLQIATIRKIPSGYSFSRVRVVRVRVLRGILYGMYCTSRLHILLVY